MYVYTSLMESGLFSQYSDGLRAGLPGFDSRKCKIFLSTTSRSVLGLTQPPIQWAPGALSSGVKRPGREANKSPPSSAEFKNGGSIPPLPHISSWNSDLLIN
jgi:hypothetical protein